MTPITFLVIGCLFHYVITGCAEVTGLTLKTYVLQQHFLLYFSKYFI